MRMAVEGSQTYLAAAELKQAKRGIDDLPIEFKCLVHRYPGKQVQQGGNGAAGGKHGDAVLVVRLLDDAHQAGSNLLDIALPVLQVRLVVLICDPASDQFGEQALKFGAVLRAVAQDVQGLGFLRQELGQQRTNDRVGVELVEGFIDFQAGRIAQLRQGGVGCFALAAQAATEAAIQSYAKPLEV